MQARIKNPVMLIPGSLQALLALDKSTEAADVPYVTRSSSICAPARSTTARSASTCMRVS
jgi:hypothetical protein